MLMSDRDIKQAIQAKQLNIENFSVECLQPASYDMRLGSQAFTSSGKKLIKVDAENPLVIEPGDLILVATLERVELPLHIAGRIGLRSYWARRGLTILSGPQIDPGFKGILVVGLCNLNANNVVINYATPFCTIEFYKLSTAAEKPYQGPYQNQDGIPKRDCESVASREAAWAPVERRLIPMEERLKEVEGKIETWIESSTEFIRRMREGR